MPIYRQVRENQPYLTVRKDDLAAHTGPSRLSTV